MILVEIFERVPGFDKAMRNQISLSSHNDSNPGNVKPGKRLQWTAAIHDTQRGKVVLVTVNHDEGIDPEESDVQITHDPKYVVLTSAKTIVSEIIKEMNDYHS